MFSETCGIKIAFEPKIKQFISRKREKRAETIYLAGKIIFKSSGDTKWE